jgi:hypothetical protein
MMSQTYRPSAATEDPPSSVQQFYDKLNADQLQTERRESQVHGGAGDNTAFDLSSSVKGIYNQA